MGIPFLDLERQYATIRSDIDPAMRGVIESQRFILGEPVERLEDDVARFTSAGAAIGCASGTDALLLPLKALELEPGTEVVVPSFTFFATAGAVWNAGLRPVFADSDPLTFNVTRETLEAAVTDRTGAIVVVHLFGQMAEMQPILDFARERGVAVIEDAAQAFGARQQLAGEWRTAGSVADVGSFSFFPTKILGGFGDGGMVVTDDPQIGTRVRKLRVHGGRKMYQHEMVGTNSRLDALQAAVLHAKLPHTPAWLGERRRVAARYDHVLNGVGDVVVPTTLDHNQHAFNVYTIRTGRRDALRDHLTALGIATSVYYPLPLHLQECFGELGFGPGHLPVAERLSAEVLSLPIFPELTDREVEQVGDAIRDFFQS